MSDCKAFYGIGEDYFAGKKCTNTSQEIARQPELFSELGQMLLEKKNDISGFFKRAGGINKRRIIFTGAGSSAYIGDALEALTAKNFGIKTESIHTTDIVTAPGSHLFADMPTLLVSFSRSGNSPESSGTVKYARSVIKDLYEIAITCDTAGALYNITGQSGKSLIIAMPPASNDKGFAMTGSVTCMLLAGFALFAMDRADDIVRDMALLGKNINAAGPGYTKTAKEWADKDFNRIVYLGCGFLKHIAHEASLKMMELTAGIVNGSYESAAGFRHGPKSVIDGKTVTVHIISNDPFTAKYDMDLLKEICSEQKRNMILTIRGDGSAEDSGAGGSGGTPGDETVIFPAGGYTAAGDICAGIQALVFCQMLAMFKSLSLKIAPDDPSPGGEVNKVVKGVNIYELG